MTASPKTATPPRPRKLAPRQLAANLRNAQKSTGPRTEAGKKTSRLNARRHDLTGHVSVLPDADRAAIEVFCRGIVAALAPGSDFEMQLARSVAEAQWRLNRARSIEDNFFALHIADYADHSMAHGNIQIADALHQARAFAGEASVFDRLTLYEQRIQRAMTKNVQLFNEAKQQRLASQSAKTSTAKTTTAASEAKANNGFLFANAPAKPNSPVERKGRCPAPPFSRETLDQRAVDATRFTRSSKEWPYARALAALLEPRP